MTKYVSSDELWILECVQAGEVLVSLCDCSTDENIYEGALYPVEDQQDREMNEWYAICGPAHKHCERSDERKEFA